MVKMSEFAQPALRNKKVQWQAAFDRHLRRNQRWVPTDLLDHYDGLEASRKRVEGQIEEDNPDPLSVRPWSCCRRYRASASARRKSLLLRLA
jgi:hypothetical protein